MATTGGRPTCDLCGETIDQARSACRYVKGWAAQRDQGGTNALRLRVPATEPGRSGWAHNICVDSEVARQKRNRAGIHDDQGAWEF
jgi:hypothetical protein